VLTTGMLYPVALSYKQLHSSMSAYAVAVFTQMHWASIFANVCTSLQDRQTQGLCYPPFDESQILSALWGGNLKCAWLLRSSCSYRVNGVWWIHHFRRHRKRFSKFFIFKNLVKHWRNGKDFGKQRWSSLCGR